MLTRCSALRRNWRHGLTTRRRHRPVSCGLALWPQSTSCLPTGLSLLRWKPPTPITLRCRTGTPEDLTSALARHELDVVITDRPPAGDEDFRWYLNPLSQSAISLFAEPALAQRLAPGFPDSLDGFPFLASALEAPYYQQLMQWFRDRGIRLNEAAEIDDSALIKVFGRAGLGVFAAPTVIREEVCRQYQVEEIASIEAVRDQIYALYGVEGMRHPGIQAICSGR
ncbi:LysR substrate-binding domain-containing protein [uncultured Halovibrio sp.]|uniref:LysR substrate-binding domain-containing protein n=1 Tax=uncultured Halovibrio sp. TaxID=985049 RepID=UPI0025F54EAD|nr:LysR substrate-binding domain-containing protein [uncultured Halovibrio sp.]